MQTLVMARHDLGEGQIERETVERSGQPVAVLWISWLDAARSGVRVANG